MKNIFKLLVVAIVAICATLPASAAVSSKSKDVDTYVTQEFHASIDCDACVKKVMNTLPNQKGVKDVEVDLKKKIITVKYDAKKCSDSNVIKALSKIDISAKVNNGVSSKSTSQSVSSKSSKK